MPKKLGVLADLAHHATYIVPFMIDLTDSAVKVVRECLRDFDDDLSVDEDPVLYLLILGYEEKIVSDLYQNNPEALHHLAFQEAVKARAAEIVAEIRRNQLFKVLFRLQQHYPMLANKYREIEKIEVDQLPAELKSMVLGPNFTHEQFVRAYLGHTTNPKVYDLTPAWQLWAAEKGLHPALSTRRDISSSSTTPRQGKPQNIVKPKSTKRTKGVHKTGTRGRKTSNPLRKAFIATLLSTKPEITKIGIHAYAYDFCREHNQELPTIDMIYNDLIYLDKHPEMTAEALLKLSKDKKLTPGLCDNSVTIKSIKIWLDNSGII